MGAFCVLGCFLFGVWRFLRVAAFGLGAGFFDVCLRRRCGFIFPVCPLSSPLSTAAPANLAPAQADA